MTYRFDFLHNFENRESEPFKVNKISKYHFRFEKFNRMTEHYNALRSANLFSCHCSKYANLRLSISEHTKMKYSNDQWSSLITCYLKSKIKYTYCELLYYIDRKRDRERWRKRGERERERERKRDQIYDFWLEIEMSVFTLITILTPSLFPYFLLHCCFVVTRVARSHGRH